MIGILVRMAFEVAVGSIVAAVGFGSACALVKPDRSSSAPTVSAALEDGISSIEGVSADEQEVTNSVRRVASATSVTSFVLIITSSRNLVLHPASVIPHIGTSRHIRCW